MKILARNWHEGQKQEMIKSTAECVRVSARDYDTKVCVLRATVKEDSSE